MIAAIERGDAETARDAALANWRNAASRLRLAIELSGERGSWSSDVAVNR